MINWMKRRYAGYLVKRLDDVSLDLARTVDWYDSSDFNEYTEGWLGHLERRIEDLINQKQRLVDRLNRLTLS